MLAKSHNIIPVIGARKRTQLTESLAATQISLTPQELARIEQRIPAEATAGTSYDAHQMAMLDRERPG